jgi:hypothetical protein
MSSDRFDEGFQDTDGRDDWWVSAETEADPEPDFGFGDAPETEPDFGTGDWDDAEPEPDPEELWPRTEDGVDEPPPVSPPPAPQAVCEPLGAPQAGEQGLGRARRLKANNPFIKGPLCREWFIRAGRLPKAAIKVGLALWFKAGVEKDDFIRGERAESLPIRVDRGLKRRFEISPPQLSRGLHALARAGLIRIVKGGVGRCSVVVIVNVQIPPPVGSKSST